MRFFCIGDEDTVLGFRLVGIEGRTVNSAFEAKEAFKVAVSTEDIGIIIITEKIARMIPDNVNKYIYEMSFPLVIEIPDANGPLSERKSIKELVKEAVGISI